MSPGKAEWDVRLSAASRGLPLSQFRSRLGLERYQALFDEIVAQAHRHGLVKDRLRLKDATHVIANIAVPSTLALVAQVRNRLLESAAPYALERVVEEQTKAVEIRQATADLSDRERLMHRVEHLRGITQWADALSEQLGAINAADAVRARYPRRRGQGRGGLQQGQFAVAIGVEEQEIVIRKRMGRAMPNLATSHLLACPRAGGDQSAAPRVLFPIFYFPRLPMPIPTARPFFRGVLLATVLLVVSPDAFAQPREKCAQERADAENFYLEGQFDEAIRLLQACVVREELFVEEAVQVYRLMGLAYMNKSDMEQAQRAIYDLLQIVPNYEADPIQDPPSYMTLVALVRQEVAAEALAEAQQTPSEQPQVSPDQPQPRTEEPAVSPVVTPTQPLPQRRSRTSAKTWLLATGGAIVVVTAVALALGGGSGSNR